MPLSHPFPVLLVPLLLLAVVPARAQTDDPVARYQKAMRGAESERTALAPQLAAVPGARSTALLRSELGTVRSRSLQLALLSGLAAYPRPEVASAVAGALRPSDPDPELATAVGKALAAMGDAGVPELRDAIERFATGRSNHRDRPAVHANLVTALGTIATPAARGAIAELARKGPGADRHRLLLQLADAGPEPAVQAARRDGLQGDHGALVVEALRQLARHDTAHVGEHLQAVAARAHGPLAAALQSGIAEVGAQHLRPELHALWFSAAAEVDPTMARQLRPHAAKLRADPDLGRTVLDRLSSLTTPGERALAARLLGAVRDPAATVALAELSQAREPMVADAALEALGARGDPAAVPVLRKLVRAPDADRRRVALHALHQLLRQQAEWHDELRAAIADPELCTLALDLLAELNDEGSLPAAHRLFTAADWRVRAAAYDFCARVRAASSVPALIDRLAGERDRMRQDVIDALTAVTGQALRTEMQWRAWWLDHGAGFTPPPARAPARRSAPAEGGTRTYYSIPVVSAAVMFVVDHSGSMAATIGTGGGTRLDEAKRQLGRVLDATPAGHRVGVVAFATGVQAMQERLLALDPGARSGLSVRVKALRAAGGTNVHDAMAAAFADPDVDTIYLLTDGAPSAGAITDPVALRAALAQWNRSRRIRIHTIAVGTDNQMLRGIAADSGGQYVSVR